MKPDIKKFRIINLPYLLFVYLFDNVGQAYRWAEGTAFADKLIHFISGFAAAFENATSSFSSLTSVSASWTQLLSGWACSPKPQRPKVPQGMEYGTARWGTAADIKPHIDSDFANNVLLTQTERITMNNRPKQLKYARNKNALVIGGSGSGKTRFFVSRTSCRSISHMSSPIPMVAYN